MSDLGTVHTTCTECTAPIQLTTQELHSEAWSARLCVDCALAREKDNINRSMLRPMLGLGNYCMKVELQWAITEQDLIYLSHGDREEDFARRSQERARSVLGLFAGCGHKFSPIGHYHLGEVRRCSGESVFGHRPQGLMREYHDALQSLLDVMRKRHMDDIEEARPDVLSQIYRALAIGRRQGWPIAEDIDPAVAAAEDANVPMHSDEAKSRLFDVLRERSE